MESLIYEGSAGLIKFKVPIITEQFVAHLVVKRTSEIVGKFSYPARDGYQLLEVDELDYLGKLTPEMTLNLSTEVIRLEVKPFIDDDTTPIGAVDIRLIKDNTLKNIQKI